MVISLTGIEGWLPFIVISSLSFLAVIPLITINVEDPVLPEKKSFHQNLCGCAGHKKSGAFGMDYQYKKFERAA